MDQNALEVILQAKEMNFITVGQSHYGGDQNWNRHWLMRLGGCSTTTACESCICLARDHEAMRPLYPFDLESISVDDFRNFSEIVFPFVHPGIGGLTSIEKYAGMVEAYAGSCGVDVRGELLSGDRPFEEAQSFIRRAVMGGYPVAYLMLRHRDLQFDEFEWHWFSVTGFRQTQESFTVTAATYGRRFHFDLARAWDTGYGWKGGLVVARPSDANFMDDLEENV